MNTKAITKGSKWRLPALIGMALCVALLAWRAPAPNSPNDAAAPVVKNRSAPSAISSRAASTQPLRPSSAPSATLSMRLAKIESRVDQAAPVEELFESPRQLVPTATPAPAPARPLAPAFPFTFMGALQEGAVRTVFLSAADRVVTVKPQDVIDGIYRIDRITAEEMTVTYLPLKQQQVISLRAAS